MPVPAQLLYLIEVFGRNAEAYHHGAINETETRVQFIDPLFELLGWDMHNARGYSEAFKDVVHEDAVRIEGTPRAPDYGFRIGGQRVFFLEAKKPAVNLDQDPAPALQLRRYAWTCKLPLSILTDFEEFAVYDTRIKPLKTDKASTARIQFIRYTDYPEHWEHIASVFSKEAVLQGSFHTYAEAATGKKGTAGVDAEFLAEIERWRDALARTIALRNPALSSRELNFAVQKIIDRIIFLRMCEDRGIEPYGQLLALTNGAQVYPRLLELFFAADQRYNSGLFHFHRENDVAEAPDDLTPAIALDDKPLKDIFRALYYPDCPYQFSVLPIQILGDVYEQFLGKVIRLTPGHQAKIEYKPEVKKAGGVQYTPAFVTHNIVKNTIGTLIARSVERAAAITDAARRYVSVLAAVDTLTLCDPACGSGSFLIAAYQYLLDWYLQWHTEHAAHALHAKTPPFHQTRTGESRLTTAEKKRILRNSIFGVDIDSQAVEVTKLSLLLKVLEGENEESINAQLKLFHERALPNLSSNIKCGNSLIGPEFYAQHELQLLDEEERLRINVFDWQAAFPHVFRQGGFSAVIGNPPYVRIQVMKEWAAQEVEHYKKAYASAHKGNYDIYVVFVEKGLQLLKDEGLLGYILPHKFFNAQYGEPLRKLIADGKHLERVIHFGDQQVFKGVTTYTCLLFLNKSGSERCEVTKVTNLDEWQLDSKNNTTGIVQSENITEKEWNLSIGKGANLHIKLEIMPTKLSHVADRIFQGLVTGADSVFVLGRRSNTGSKVVLFSRALEDECEIEAGILKPLLKGAEIHRYNLDVPKNMILFPYREMEGRAILMEQDYLCKNFPLAWKYLNAVRHILYAREGGKWNTAKWWQFGRNQNIADMLKPKLLTQVLSRRGSFTCDRQAEYCFVGGGNAGGYGVQIRPDSNLAEQYLLGLLNSTLLDWCLKRVSTTFRGGFFSYARRFISELPIRMIDFSNANDKKCHQQMTQYVETMLALHQRLAAVRTPHERSQLEQQIAATDHLIDQLVYQLYGLTDDEIRIVERA